MMEQRHRLDTIYHPGREVATFFHTPDTNTYRGESQKPSETKVKKHGFIFRAVYEQYLSSTFSGKRHSHKEDKIYIEKALILEEDSVHCRYGQDFFRAFIELGETLKRSWR